MSQNTIDGDLLVTGRLVPGSITLPDASVTNVKVPSGAGIAASKLEHQYQRVVNLANFGTTPAANRQTVALVHGTTGTLSAIYAGLITPLASGTLTVDLYKNGSSILSAPIVLNSSGGSGGTLRDKVVGAFSSAGVVVGDILEVVGTVSSPSGGGGWYLALKHREDAD